MDTDSLLVHRIATLMKQPKTVRGRTILWYASLNDKPGTRIVVVMLFVIFIMIHFIAFVALLKIAYQFPTRYTIFEVLCPLFLLLLYPLILIPIIIYFMAVDIKKKSEGLLVWHRDSLLDLLQRWFMCLLLIIAFGVFDHCGRGDAPFATCAGKSLIPLFFPIICIACKVSCLQNQRMVFWIGFLICLTTQLILLEVLNVKFRRRAATQEPYGETRVYLDAWLIFIPSMIFGIMVDIECLIQTKIYKPVAFKEAPKNAQIILFLVGCLSLCASVFLIIFSFFAFSPLIPVKQFVIIFYDCIAIKAVCWSPFMALEYFDTVFENIYVDVQFQLNPISPQKLQMPKLNPPKQQWDDDESQRTNNRISTYGPTTNEQKPQFGNQLPKIPQVKEDDPVPESDNEGDAVSKELNITEMERIAAGKRSSLGRNESIESATRIGSIGGRQASLSFPEKTNTLDAVMEGSNSSQSKSIISLNRSSLNKSSETSN